MRQLKNILAALLFFLGDVAAIIIKFFVFLLISPITVCRCVPHAWRHKRFKAGWQKFTWIWGAYWNQFNL